MRKLLVSIGMAAALVTVTGGAALADPPAEPPSAGALHACMPHGAPGTVNLPNAPFCPL